MKRVLGLVALFGAASSLSLANAAPAVKLTPAQKAAAVRRAAEKRAAAIAKLAPADEYFGPLKESVIGINLSIRNLGWNYDVNHDIGDKTFASASLTERAIKDWAVKYPHDDQLPRSIFLLQRLYTKILTQASRDHAHVIAMWLFGNFSASPQARQLHKTLALEHLAPIPTPTPVPMYPSAFGSAYPSEFDAQPSPSPVPIPKPSL